MPLPRRYSIKSLLAATAIVAGVLAVLVPLGLFGSLLMAVSAGMPLVKAFGAWAAYGPGVAAILALIFLGATKPRLLLGSVGGVLAAAVSLASPQLSAWYTWHVLNDHTANIGAGLLYLAQPVMAPVLAATAFFMIEGLRQHLLGSTAAKEEPPEGPFPPLVG